MRSTGRYARAFAALGASALLLLTSCTKTLDTAKLESEITKGIEQQTDFTVKSIDCPEDRKAKAGDTFTCKVTATDGSTGTVKVTQKDDEGNVRWELESS
jgi:uncharacterized protein DUF4333